MKKRCIIAILLLLVVSGRFYGQGISIGSGAYITVSGSPWITIASGNFENNGTYTKATETITMSGTAAATVTGTSTTVNNLTISNTGGVTNQQSLLTVNNTLTIESGAKLTIASSKALTVNGTTQVNATEGLVIATEGSFLDNGTINYSSGSAKAEHYLTGSRWWYIGSPMTAATAAAFGTLSSSSGSGTRLYYWDEPNNGYQPIVTSTTVLNPLQGYAYKKYDGNLTASFTGSLNTGSIGTDNNLEWTSGKSHDGFNLVCNPYPSAIDWDASSGWTKTNIENNIWYRTNSTYATYNGTSHEGVNGGQKYIPALQAYWVHVPDSYGAKGTLKVTNATRLHNSQAFYKATSVNNVFRMIVRRDTLNDEMLVGFYPSASATYEDFDAEKMFSTDNDHPQITTLTFEHIEVAINGQPELAPNEIRTIPLGFLTKVSGDFTFEATNLDELDPAISVYLEDLMGIKRLDLRATNTYSFYSAPASGDERFRLHFGKSSVNAEPTPADNGIRIFANDLTVNLYLPADLPGTLEVFNVLGQRILQRPLEPGFTLLCLNVDKGLYIFRIQANHTVTTKKLFLGK
ncbi:MAG: T9SS type A sorting domain-containing protein [Bacteroidales bacterium]|nr:T9SS type A sorting domain-containing protein [Bacteroidales bacterium]